MKLNHKDEILFKQLDLIIKKIGGHDKVTEWAFIEAERLLKSQKHK